MRALRLAIEDSLRAENIGDSGVGGGCEFSVPLAGGCHSVEVVVLDLHAFRDLLLLLRTGLGKFPFDGELDLGLRILPGGYGKLVAESEFRKRAFGWTRRPLARQIQRVSAGCCLEADPGYCEPRFAGHVEAERNLMAEPRSSQRFERCRGRDLK